MFELPVVLFHDFNKFHLLLPGEYDRKYRLSRISTGELWSNIRWSWFDSLPHKNFHISPSYPPGSSIVLWILARLSAWTWRLLLLRIMYRALWIENGLRRFAILLPGAYKQSCNNLRGKGTDRLGFYMRWKLIQSAVTCNFRSYPPGSSMEVDNFPGRLGTFELLGLRCM